VFEDTVEDGLGQVGIVEHEALGGKRLLAVKSIGR